MRALTYDPDRRHPRLTIDELPDPEPAAGEVVVDIAATAMNHADLLQVRDLYPVPEGESSVPGLECAGTIRELGPDVGDWQEGDRVMALLGGGGHGERVAVPAGQLIPLPENLSFVEGAAIPEVAITAWTNLVHEGGLVEGETLLITAAASGVGTFAAQVARELGARVLVAGRKIKRLKRLEPLGADACLPLGEELPSATRKANDEEGADLVLDLVGGSGFRHHLAALRDRERLVLVGLVAGARAEVDLGDILRRRLTVIGSVLRARSREAKAALVAAFSEFGIPRLADGRLRPIVDRTFPFDDIGSAYAALAAGGVFGKIVVEM